MELPIVRYCGRSTIQISRRDDGEGWDCQLFVSTPSSGWRGVVPQPFRLADDGSPEMFDEIAKTAAHYAVSAGFEDRLALNVRASDYVVRRERSFSGRKF